jgi:hypothetical protein
MSEIKHSEIVEKALRYAAPFFHSDRNLVYHNYQFCIALCNRIGEIANEESTITQGESNHAKLASIFYTLGIAQNRAEAEQNALSLWSQYSAKESIDPSIGQSVKDCLICFFQKKKKTNAAQKLMADGIHVQTYARQDASQTALYKMEALSFESQEISNLEWNSRQHKAIQEVNFFYPYTELHYKPILNQQLLDYTQKIKRNKRNGPKAWELEKLRNFQNLERRLPNDATQTFFRANFRNHINLSAIADQKANIMISVNAIMISVLISVLSYRNITETNPMVIMPVVIFLITGLTSLICAVLSARPKVTKLNRSNMPIEEVQKNIVFFGNFVHLTLEQYEEAVDAMFRDSELIYGNMVRDLYYLGKVLDQKYRYLSISYSVFMVGFVVTVLTFMIAFLS